MVDDDLDDSDLFVEAMHDVDPSLTCQALRSGRQLIEKLGTDTHKPDVIFLDLNMPEMNGLECLSALKKTAGLQDIPIVIYTTSSNPSDKQRAYTLGASLFYTKPHTYSQLRDFLDDFVNQRIEFSNSNTAPLKAVSREENHGSIQK